MEFVYYNPTHNIEQLTVEHIYKTRRIYNLYDIYTDYFRKELVQMPRNSLLQNRNKNHTNQFYSKEKIISNPIVLQKQKIFLEIEYLEKHYEEINVFFSPNKTITVEAFQPKKIEQPEQPEHSVQLPLAPYKKMPIFSFCREIVKQSVSSYSPTTTQLPSFPNKLSIVFPKEYPTEPPSVFINDIPYINLIHSCYLERVKRTVKKYVKTYRHFIHCVSCGSLIVKPNWKPNIHLSAVLQEYLTIKNLSRVIKQDIVMEELREHRQLDYQVLLLIIEYIGL